MEVFFERNCIRGYHVYKNVWAATVGGIGVRKRVQKIFQSIRCGCERQARARGMTRSIIRIVIIHCKENSL